MFLAFSKMMLLKIINILKMSWLPISTKILHGSSSTTSTSTDQEKEDSETFLYSFDATSSIPKVISVINVKNDIWLSFHVIWRITDWATPLRIQSVCRLSFWPNLLLWLFYLYLHYIFCWPKCRKEPEYQFWRSFGWNWKSV